MEPDFSKYSLLELNESLRSINKEKYPGTYNRLINELKYRCGDPVSKNDIFIDESFDQSKQLNKCGVKISDLVFLNTSYSKSISTDTDLSTYFIEEVFVRLVIVFPLLFLGYYGLTEYLKLGVNESIYLIMSFVLFMLFMHYRNYKKWKDGFVKFESDKLGIKRYGNEKWFSIRDLEVVKIFDIKGYDSKMYRFVFKNDLIELETFTPRFKDIEEAAMEWLKANIENYEKIIQIKVTEKRF